MNKSSGSVILMICLCINIQIHAQRASQVNSKKTYTTKAISIPPVIDGVLNDESWKNVEWAVDFIEKEPDENTAPSQQTQFKIVYDEKNLYIGVRAFDSAPDSIVKRLSRRDGFIGDRVSFVVDSYHDLRTAFIFTVTAAGVKGDEIATDNGNQMDDSWNPVWYTKSAIDSKGWTAEMKIPFSQLRFGVSEEQVWGLNFARTFFRKEEMSVWNRVPIEASGFVSESGLLLGLKNLIPQKQIEIQPYIVAQTASFEKEIGNPFATGKDSKLVVGLDGKIGITNDLTLDFTINPDFGQVEADPSEISLDGSQIFFEEQRPFFVENKNIFDYKITNSKSGGPFTKDNLFYSRRIGRQPQNSPETAENEYVEIPENTTILGAAKFSGKTKKGWSIGVLEALTQKEFAKIDNNGERREEVVEPLTNYLLTRIQKDFNNNNSFVGGIITATSRSLEANNISLLNSAAYTGGIDFKHQWENRKYYVEGNIVASNIIGSKEAILEAQLDHRRYFQRVDASHVEVDPSRTSLSGHGGNLQVGKAGGKHFNFESGVTWRSPGLELNDMGFQGDADDIIHSSWIGYKILKPFSIFRSLKINYNHYAAINFGGDHTYLGFSNRNEAEFKNYWQLGIGLHYAIIDYSDSALRGGPQLRISDSFNSWMNVGTDKRKKLQFSFRTMQNKGQQNSYKLQDYGVEIKYVPFDAFNISVVPSYTLNDQELQFVENIDYNGSTRYLNASLEQDTFSMSVRFNYTIRPNLTIQYYGQPFISRGRYMNFKYITDSKARNFTDRFQNFSANQIAYNADTEVYSVDENTDATTDYSFENPDFSIVEFRSNLVVRWEYIPGSEVFLVWSQGISTSANPNDNLLPSLNDNIFRRTAQNIFLIKATYRFFL